MRNVSVTKIFSFETAHKLLESYSDECQNIHGHSYKLEVTISDPYYDERKKDMVIDFKLLKELVTPLINTYDHKVVICEDDPCKNDLIRTKTKLLFCSENPTAENMAIWFKEQLENKLFNTGFNVRIKLWETDTCFVEVE